MTTDYFDSKAIVIGPIIFIFTMSSVSQITAVINELVKEHGESIPVADLRQAMAKLCESDAGASSSAVSPKVIANQCVAMTKGANAKQCSKSGTHTGTDDRSYCTTHFRATFPELATEAAAAKPKAAAASSSKPAPKAVIGKGSLNPSCDHDITGKNPRKCTAAGKVQVGDKWYCGTHSKSKVAGPAKGNNAAASAKLAKAVEMETPSPIVDKEYGLARDQNGLCYVADWKGQGLTVACRISGGELVAPTALDEKFCQERDLQIIPADERERLIALSPAERLAKYINPFAPQ